MTGYTKLFSDIITSTIWRERNETRILWITMLAMKNKMGIVSSSIPGLADMARISIQDTLDSLHILRSPDPYSRTKEFEGRRIKEVEGGWLILNHQKWRAKMNQEERREYLRIKQAEYRQRKQSVNKRKQMSTLSTHTDTDTDNKAVSVSVSDTDTALLEDNVQTHNVTVLPSTDQQREELKRKAQEHVDMLKAKFSA